MQCDQPHCSALAISQVSNITPGRVLLLCQAHTAQAWEIAHLLNAQIKVEPVTPSAHGGGHV